MKDANQAAEQVAYVKKRHPEVTDFSATSNSEDAYMWDSIGRPKWDQIGPT